MKDSLINFLRVNIDSPDEKVQSQVYDLMRNILQARGYNRLETLKEKIGVSTPQGVCVYLGLGKKDTVRKFSDEVKGVGMDTHLLPGWAMGYTVPPAEHLDYERAQIIKVSSKKETGMDLWFLKPGAIVCLNKPPSSASAGITLFSLYKVVACTDLPFGTYEERRAKFFNLFEDGG